MKASNKPNLMVAAERSPFDDLFTPKEALPPLLKYLPGDIKTAWECTDPGEGNITRILRESGREVITSDIKNGFDFLKQPPQFEFDAIITNPPYSLKDQFLARCYQYQKPFALLLPVTTLGAGKRNRMFAKWGISVIVLDSRLDFTGKGAPWFSVAWFCWQILPKNSLIFEVV